jgi:hypothetical protein
MDCWASSNDDKKIVSGWLWVFCVFWKSSEKTLQVTNFCYISLDSVEPRYFFLKTIFLISFLLKNVLNIFVPKTNLPINLPLFDYICIEILVLHNESFMCTSLVNNMKCQKNCTNIDTYHAFWNWNREHGVSSNAFLFI